MKGDWIDHILSEASKWIVTLMPTADDSITVGSTCGHLMSAFDQQAFNKARLFPL